MTPATAAAAVFFESVFLEFWVGSVVSCPLARAPDCVLGIVGEALVRVVLVGEAATWFAVEVSDGVLEVVADRICSTTYPCVSLWRIMMLPGIVVSNVGLPRASRGTVIGIW